MCLTRFAHLDLKFPFFYCNMHAAIIYRNMHVHAFVSIKGGSQVNSVLSTRGAKYMCLVIKNFYLTAPPDRYKYMKMPLSLFPSWTKEQYNLDKLAKNGFVYLEMRRAVWGLPQAGILANRLLQKRLLPHGYYECKHTPGLWRHFTRPISFTLVANDFGVKYVGREHVDHLIKCIKESDLYCGIKLNWDYTARTVDISMPGYFKKLLQKYKHKMPTKPQHCPYTPAPKQYGTEAPPPSQPTSPPNYQTEKSKKFNESLVAFCITHGRLSSRS